MRVLPLSLVIVTIGIFCLLYSEILQGADIDIADSRVLVRTDAYEVEFTDGVITQIANKVTAESYVLPVGVNGKSGILRQYTDPIWTSQSTVEVERTDPLAVKLLFTQGQNEITMAIAVDIETGDLIIEQEGVSESAGVYGIQWGCGNLDMRSLELVIPAQGGQIIDEGSAIVSRDFDYPGRWEAQLAIVQGQNGGFFVRSEDETFQFKVLHYDREIDSFALGFETQNQAPFDTLKFARSVTWRLNTYAGNWRVPARLYRDWMERAFEPRSLSNMPSWVEEIGLVVIHDGLDTEILSRLSELVDPTKTLLYLPDWRKDGYDINYPEYTARADFGDFVEAAHQYGFRVMPHANLVGVAPYHPLYADLQNYQFRTPFGGELVGWWWDRVEAPQRHAFINLACSEFRKLFVQRLKEVWEKYHVDAFHLDVSHPVINDANGLIEGLNAGQGNALIHRELAEAMPEVAFSGESLHEVTFFRESFAQRWKLPPEAKPHPISSFLFSPYTLPYGYLGMPNPDASPKLYQEYLDSYESWGVLPTLRLDGIEQLTSERSGTQDLLTIARAWQELELRPDLDDEWEDETLFQFVGQSGEVGTYRRTEAGSILDLPYDSAGYERVFGSTQVKTDRSIPYWRAYNETAILGLDPAKHYFLSDVPRDYSQLHINSLPEGVSVTESRVTGSAALFRLERTDISQNIDLLSEMKYARTGIVIDGVTMPRQGGATFQPSEASVSGITKPAIFAHPPYEGGVGDVFGEFTVLLPDSPAITLECDIGLGDGSENSDGVTFTIHIQDHEIFREHYAEQEWRHVSLDLTSYGDQQVILRFTTNPGPRADTGWDWAYWGEPRIAIAPLDTPIEVGFFIPENPVAFPDNIQSMGQGQYYLGTRLPEQILFLFKPMQRVIPPYDLREAQFVAGLQFDSIFQIGSVWGSGDRTVGTCDGITRQSIFAHPPDDGQTIIQFVLSLPKAEDITFSFSMGLGDGSCSDGLHFEVLTNGESRLEHFTDAPGWMDASISLSESSGKSVLLELLTGSGENSWCDWAHWADLSITAEGLSPDWDVNEDAIVDILDLLLIAKCFGEAQPEDPRADVNHDGVVDILDIIIVCQHFGED